MTELWALTACASDADATTRADEARHMEEWVAAGGAGVALVTCHRAELYGFGAMPALAAVRVHSGEPAIRHLLRVASGLESVIVGEDEVLHQVRDALRDARAKRRLDGRVQRLLETAIAAGRKARAGRTESSGNLAQNAVEWLRGKAELSGRPVVVAGAGRMGAVLAHSAVGAGAELIIASRDASKAGRLARMYAGLGVDLHTVRSWPPAPPAWWLPWAALGPNCRCLAVPKCLQSRTSQRPRRYPTKCAGGSTEASSASTTCTAAAIRCRAHT